MKTKKAQELLQLTEKSLYTAGYPGYMRNFSRDSLLYGLIAGDTDALLKQIAYSAKHQGRKVDAQTGEEPGKIHHELPAGKVRGRPTTYNACDTNALFLMSIGILALNGHSDLLDRYSENIDLALTYTNSHMKNGLFHEDPALVGVDSFALRVTYWKDSVLGAEYDEPHYPIIYSLVHFQYAYAFDVLGRALDNQGLIEQSTAMKKRGLDKLWREDHFVTALDDIEIDHPSSDSLHILLYLEHSDLPSEYALKVQEYSRALATKAGYKSGIVGYESDNYHTKYVWVFEQALLHAAAKKHNLKDAVKTTKQVVNYLGNGFPELIDTEYSFVPAGNNPQLWSVGAQKYFSDSQNSYISAL